MERRLILAWLDQSVWPISAVYPLASRAQRSGIPIAHVGAQFGLDPQHLAATFQDEIHLILNHSSLLK